MSNSSNSWFDNFLATHQRPNQKGQAPSTGQKTQSGNSWLDDFLSTHQRPKQKEEAPAGVKPLPVVGKDKPILESVERDDGIFSMQAPKKKQTAPEETPAAVKPAFERDQWLQDYAKEAERIFTPDQAYQEQKVREEYIKNQEDLRRNQEVTAKNLATLESWPEEDRQMLIQYAINDHRGRSLWDRSSTSATRAATALVELQKKYDKDTIERMAESYRWYTNEIATNTMRDEAAKEVQGKPGAAIVHSGIARLAGLAGSVTAPLDYLGQALGGTGQYSTLDPNAVGNLPNVYSSTVTQTVAKDIEGDGKSVGRKAASYLYQGGMSALDTGARLLASGGNPTLAATLAGLGTFGQTVSQASAQGATPAQAIAYGTAAAGIEALTEKLPLDELVKTAKGGWNGLKPAIKEAFKQAGIEVAEEEIGLIATTLTEMAILQEKASTNQRIQQLVVEEGMSVEEANNQVMYELLGEAMDTAVVSAISGGLSSAGGSVVAYAGRDTGGAQTAQEGTEAAKSQETTVAEVTSDTAADQQQTQAEEPQSNVQKAVQEFRDTGKVSNRMAEVILNDAESVAALQKETKMELPDTASGRRNAVKDAVAQLSRNEDAKDLTSSTAEALLRKQEQPQEAKAEDPEKNRRLAIEATRELQGLTMQETVENVDTSQNGLSNQDSANMDHGAVGAADGDYGDNTVGSAESRFRHEVRRSKVYDNTYKNATSKRVREVGKKTKKLDKKIAEYDYISEDESVYNALQRVRETGTDVFSYSNEAVEAEYAYLVEKEGWTGEDNDTATLVLDYLMENGEMEKLRTLAKKKRENITAAAQLVQSQAKYTRPETPREAAYDAAATLEDLTEQDVPKKFYKEQGFENWKNGITNAILDIADDMEDISDNDAASMRGIIRQLANLRKTTAWMGYSSNLTKAADRMVNKLDYKTAKDIAMAQLSMIPNDYRKRSAGQIVKTIRIQNMLSGLTTVLRNGAGNTSIALMDAVADSTGGMMADMIMAKFTGIRTVNSEMKYTKEYFSAAEDAVDMAALCVELDIPMETEAAYSVGKTRNFSPQSGLVGRFLSSYEKYLKYALEVSDKFFESGASSSVSRSIQELGEKSGLNEAQIKELGEYVGKRRTYKEGRKLARANTKLKGALNEIGTEDLGAGDALMPFAGVPGDVAQVGADYSGLGALEGFVEMAKIIADKKAGKEIDPVRQRKAATDFGRGVSGVGLVAVSTLLATMGLIKVSEEPDKDKRGLAQALGLSGAQFNLTAIGRLIKGESTDWQDDDIVVNVDFLQPFNSQMYIGYLMAQEDSVGEMIAAYPKSGFRGMLQSILDMPMMTTVSDMADLATSFGEVSEDGNFDAVKDAGGQLLGDIATGFIPSWFRQVAQYVDPYYRDTSGDDALQKAWNRFISAVPFASKTLPKKYSGLGEEQLRYEDSALGFFNTFINPGAITQISGSEIADYLDTLDDVTVYPEYMAPNSITVNGEKIPISGKEMTEKYQKTYGEKVANLYGALIDSSDFNKLPKEMQIEALKQAKEYATDFAKAAVADKAEKPSVDMRNPAQYIVRKVTLSDITKSVSDVNEALDNDWDTTKAALSMETAWKAYNRLSKEAQAAIRDDAGESAAGKYIAAREAGVTNGEYVALLRNVSALKPQSGYSNVRDIQKAQAVGKTYGLSEKEREALVKGYASDAQDQNMDDMKALFNRNGKNFTVSLYLAAWEIADKNNKDDMIAAFQKKFNLDKATAEALYKIFG